MPLSALASAQLDLDAARVAMHGSASFAASAAETWTHCYLVLDRAFVLTRFQLAPDDGAGGGALEAAGKMPLADKDVVFTTQRSAFGGCALRLTHPSEGTWELTAEKKWPDWVAHLALAVHALDLGSLDAHGKPPRPPAFGAAAAPAAPADSSLDRHFSRQAAAARTYLERLSRRMQLFEIITGAGLLNLLLILILNSSPSHVEAWLFIGSVDILIGWAFAVRFEQVVFGTAAYAMQRDHSQHSLNSLEEDSSSDDEAAAPSKPAAAAAALARERRVAGNLPRAPGPFPPFGDVAGDGHIKQPAHTWSPAQASNVQVRVGPDYAVEKRHQPSARELFDLVAADVFFGDERVDRIAAQVDLPEPAAAAAAAAAVPAPLPQLLVVNFQVQRAGAAVFQTSGGPGYSLALYFAPSAGLVEQLRSGAAEPSVRLLCRWLEGYASDDALKARLKVKATVLNPEASRIPAWALKYNGHSCALAKSNKMARVQGTSAGGAAVDVLECDVDLREWSLLCRQGVNSILPIVGSVDFTLAVLLQGEADDELPERVLGLARLNYVNVAAHCEKW